MDVEKFLFYSVGSLVALLCLGLLMGDEQWAARTGALVGGCFLVSALLAKWNQRRDSDD